MDKFEELLEAATPLIEYLKKNHDPHTTANVSSNGVGIMQDLFGIPNLYNYQKKRK